MRGHLLDTFLFATSIYGLADKLDQVAVGLATLPRGAYLAQNLQISKA